MKEDKYDKVSEPDLHKGGDKTGLGTNTLQVNQIGSASLNASSTYKLDPCLFFHVATLIIVLAII